MESTNEKTKHPAFIDFLFNHQFMLVHKSDSACRMKVSSETGVQAPFLATPVFNRLQFREQQIMNNLISRGDKR